MGYEEKIKEIEEEIKKTQYNKATQHHIGLLKAKIAKLREKQESAAGSGGKGEGYSVRKTGDGTVIMIGFPSVGKSTLLNALTNADSEVAGYAFTTLDVIPGMLELKGAQIQLLDVPGIVKGAAAGTGRGKEVLSVVRNADLCLVVLDVTRPQHKEVLMEELYATGVRVNRRKADVRVKKKSKGGLSIGLTVKQTKMDRETMEGVLKEMGYINADVVVREDVNVDEFIDAIEDNKKYMPAITILNKVDLVSEKRAKKVAGEVDADLLISADRNENLEDLKDLIWKKLGLIRVYMKEPGKEADLEEPLILPKDSTIEYACQKIHRDFSKRFRFARVWGDSAKFDGQKLMRHHKLAEGDVLELHLR